MREQKKKSKLRVKEGKEEGRKRVVTCFLFGREKGLAERKGEKKMVKGGKVFNGATRELFFYVLVFF